MNVDLGIETKIPMKLLNTFLYFAIFKYPLTAKEAKAFGQYEIEDVSEDLQLLIDNKILFQIGDYFLPYNEPSWVERRIEGNIMAEQTMAKARKMGRILSRFPFVRSVMISGSLSKGYMDEFSDIDFFVIMKPGNITISKLLMGLYERIFASGSFCANFLIDADHLHIKNQNLYTAIELATLIPVWDTGLYDSFIQINEEWVLRHLPNYEKRSTRPEEMKHGIIKRIIEFFLSTSLAGFLNKRLIKFYQNRWKRRNKNYKKSIASGEVVLDEGVLKFHNGSYQDRILGLYQMHQKNFSDSNPVFSKEYFYD